MSGPSSREAIARSLTPAIVERRSNTAFFVRPLEWVSFGNRGHHWLEIRDRRNGSLVGYSAVKRQSGLVVDIFARTRSETGDVRQGTLRWFADRESSAGAAKSLKAGD